MKTSARNVIKGTVTPDEKSATTAPVEIAPGQVVTAAITDEAID